MPKPAETPDNVSSQVVAICNGRASQPTSKGLELSHPTQRHTKHGPPNTPPLPPASTTSPPIDSALIEVPNQTKRSQSKSSYHNTAMATAAGPADADGHTGGYQNLWLAAWLHDPDAPKVLTGDTPNNALDSAFGHGLNDTLGDGHSLVKYIENNSGVEIYEPPDNSVGSTQMSWDKVQCEAETRYALGGTTE